MHSTLLRTALLAACAGAFVACSSSSSSAPSSTTIVIGDAPADDLSSFQADVASLRLRRTDATTTANLLAAPVRIEFLELQDSFALLANGRIEPGTYDAILVDFTPASYAATAEDGSSVNVMAASDQLVAPFASPLTIGSGYRRIEVDLDVADSIDGDVSSGSIDLMPSGSSTSSSGESEAEIDEFAGTVLSVDAAANRLVVDAYLDDDATIELGEVTVELDAGTLLLAENGAVFADRPSFFAALVPDATMLEVHGNLGANGVVQATRIEIEDLLGGGGPVAVEIEGTIVALDADSFDLLIREVEEGSAVAGPVLAGLGDPSVIEIGYDAGTVFVIDDEDDDDALGSASDLALGQEVDVSFSTFTAEPFPAFLVEIDDEGVGFEGRITDVAGLPNQIVVRLDDDDPLVLSGDVTTSTDVVVDLTGVTPTLDVDADVMLSTADLFVGSEVEVYGAYSAGPPTITATGLEVGPGELEDGVVSSVDVAGGTFQL